jgi:hypothetical protein
VCLVHNHRKAFACGIDLDGLAFLLERADGTRNERKLLNGRYDDRDAAGECLGKLLCILVDLLNNALLVLKLVNRVLELLIKHTPVGNDNNRIEDFRVGTIVKACQVVRKPGDRIQ